VEKKSQHSPSFEDKLNSPVENLDLLMELSQMEEVTDANTPDKPKRSGSSKFLHGGSISKESFDDDNDEDALDALVRSNLPGDTEILLPTVTQYEDPTALKRNLFDQQSAEDELSHTMSSTGSNFSATVTQYEDPTALKRNLFDHQSAEDELSHTMSSTGSNFSAPKLLTASQVVNQPRKRKLPHHVRATPVRKGAKIRKLGDQ